MVPQLQEYYRDLKLKKTAGEIMKRNVDLKDISDGNLYGLNDMVKADCQDCKGCSDCCRGMGESIILDPLDIHRLKENLGLSFDELLQDKIELHLVDGVILPNLKMSGERDCCTFLDETGRCSIHGFRPGICRLFPLGRYYENRSFQYFLQVHECKNTNRSKVKVKKWIDTPEVAKYQQFISDWHFFLNDVENWLETVVEEQMRKEVVLLILQTFYVQIFHSGKDFYEQFNQRLSEVKSYLHL
jgi:Fe-S-cluster containining protein